MAAASGPLIVQSDRSLLLETGHPRYGDARDALSRFAELVTSPEHVHTYRLTPISLWNAAVAGVSADDVLAALAEFGRFPVPQNVAVEIRDTVGRYGRLVLSDDGGTLVLTADSEALLEQVSRPKHVAEFLHARRSPTVVEVGWWARGALKQALVALGYPARDVAGYRDGTALDVTLAPDVVVRDYQRAAAATFYADGGTEGGSGVVVLPPGAGKTMVGIAAMVRVGAQALVLSSSVSALVQWRSELLDKTTLSPEQIGEYSGARKDVRPVTLATYQMLTHRPSRDGPFPHLRLFDEADWGLVIYDEVHLLPAPVFRATADLQARRRLGLTATLVREDGRETDVFGLIGPKLYDAPWRELEAAGWIAAATCVEVRVDLPEPDRLAYAAATDRERIRLAAENPAKPAVVEAVLARHRGEPALVIGQYLDQLDDLADRLAAPILTGRTPQADRDELYAAFRAGEIPVLVVSKVANFAIDLPDASVAVQVSGTFGSRQEEAQRLGRLLRPKGTRKRAHFYSLVTRDTRDQDFAAKRQRFLTEQGYQYEVVAADDLAAAPVT